MKEQQHHGRKTERGLKNYESGKRELMHLPQAHIIRVPVRIFYCRNLHVQTRTEIYSSIFLKRPGLLLGIIQVGHFQLLGISSYFVPAGMPCFGSPISSS